MERAGPSLYMDVGTGPEAKIILASGSGYDQHITKATPAEYLISFVERDYSAYRKEINRLLKEHPLFEASQEISEEDFIDFLVDVFSLSAMLKEMDPIADFVVSSRLFGFFTGSMPEGDDGSASFLLRTGHYALRLLREPILAQVRLQNIFEVVFDDFERATQRERYTALKETYPPLVNTMFLSRRVEIDSGDIPLGVITEYSPRSIYELYILTLNLYFQQNKQRIARCQCCGKYFIPGTKKETLYCSRVFEGRACKQLGPNLKRKLGPESDEALKKYKQLRSRMFERMSRFETAAEWDRKNLFQMDSVKYSEWLDMAHSTRREYLDGGLTAEEFLRRIDIYNDLADHMAEKKETPPPQESKWRRKVESSIDFDPETAYPPMMVLDLSNGPAEWQYFTAEELKQMAKGSGVSLQERFGRKSTEDAGKG